jgi:hypothetical protein
MSSTVSEPPPPLPTNNVEAMFQQIMHAVHKSVSGRVVRYCSLTLTLDG